MKIGRCPLEGILLIEADRFGDERGFFLETYQRERYHKAGITDDFVQDSQSRSVRNVLRGLHFTKRRPQAQLMTVLRGKVFDVVVDIRTGSPTRGKWFGTELSDSSLCQIYMPHGFAHGFCALSDYADLHYKVTQLYEPGDEHGILWDDPELGIDWPVKDPIVSPRDAAHPGIRAALGN